MKRFDKIYVEITNVCNLNCKFCKESNRKKEFMKLKDFNVVIDKIKDYTDLIMLHIKGEPLLHPNLYEILEECEKSGVLVNITTNTTLLIEKEDEIANAKALRQLNLSMHSFSQNSMNIVQNCKRVFETVKRIKKKNKNLIISYRLWNIKDIKENDVNYEILKLLGQEYNVENIIEKSKKEKFLKLDNNIYLNQDVEFIWPSLGNQIINENGKCYGLKKQLGILVNGDVVPCCLDQNGDIKLGNIFENSIEEILNSSKAKRIIEGFNNRILTEELCKKCGFIKVRF
jgi:radical SAM protein with 4Fe4S-binding SPASM domain